MPNLDIGKEGIEKSFNEILVGKSGQREIEVNSSGRIIRERTRLESKQGKYKTNFRFKVARICIKSFKLSQSRIYSSNGC